MSLTNSHLHHLSVAVVSHHELPVKPCRAAAKAAGPWTLALTRRGRQAASDQVHKTTKTTTSGTALLAVWIGTTILIRAGLLTVHPGMFGPDDPYHAHQRPGSLDATPPRASRPRRRSYGTTGDPH